MDNITRTPYFASLLDAMARGGIYKWLEYTTLNEKFNVLPKQYPATNIYPRLRAIGLGWGGMGMTMGADNEAYPIIGQHLSTDAALFKHVPIVLRLPEDDLSIAQRARYFLRAPYQLDGKTYWAYYLKKADFSQEENNMYIKRKLADGTIVIDNFVPSEANLNPTRIDLQDPGVNLLKGQSVVSSTIINLPLDDFDINEIRKAALLIKKASGRAIVSEICLVTGHTAQVDVPVAGGGTVRMEEIIGAQIAAFIGANYAFDYLNQSLIEQLELGIAEPLFNIEGQN